MRILLVQPDSNKTCIGFKRLARPEPLGLETVAATVPDHDVRILDMRCDPDLPTTLEQFQPDLVGTTGFTAEVPHAQDVCAAARRFAPGAKVVVGGHHATMSPSEFQRSDVDFIVSGEGELSFPQLVQAIDEGRSPSTVPGVAYRDGGRFHFTGPRAALSDLDLVPQPRRDLVAQYRGQYFFRFWDEVYAVETTRGCPFRCNFCSVWRFFGGKVRFKSPERVVSEISSIPDECEYVCIVDDNFLASMPRTRKIVGLLEERDIRKKLWIQGRADAMVKDPAGMSMLARAGLSTVLMGLEAYREDELSRYNKGKGASVAVNDRAIEIMHSNGIDIWGAFLIDPRWEERDFEGLIEYVRRKKIQFLQFTILTPLPGTALYEETKHLIRGGWEQFDFFHSVLPTRLPPERFYEQMANLYRETVMSFSQMREMIRQGRIPRHGLQRAKDMLAQVTDPGAYIGSLQGGDPKDRIQGHLSAAQAALERLQQEVGSVQVEMGARLQLQLDCARQELDELQAEVRGLQCDLSARWHCELKGLQAKVDGLYQEIGVRLRSPLDGLQSDVREALRLRVEELRTDLQSLSPELRARLHQQLDLLQGKPTGGTVRG